MAELERVLEFWNANPVAAAAVPHPLFSKEYFDQYDHLRELNEPVAFSYRLHEYGSFSGKKVLDVGCGNGYVLSKYAEEGADVYGVDLTPTAIELTRSRFALRGLTGTFELANAEALPFPDETFDCVCSMGVLHHTPDTQKAVEEIWRVLRPGGRLIVMLYHRNSVLYQIGFRWQRLATRKPMQQLVNEVDGIGNPKGDVYTRAELRNLLSSFTELEFQTGLVQPWMLVPKVGRVTPQWILSRLERRWGWFLYAKGIKPPG